MEYNLKKQTNKQTACVTCPVSLEKKSAQDFKMLRTLIKTYWNKIFSL